VQSRALIQPALNSLAAGAAGAFAGFGLPASIFSPVAKALIPNGPGGVVCTSLPEETGTGVYGGHSTCSTTPQDFDRSDNFDKSYSAEAILSSKWDGMFNFLLGGIYANFHNTENSYYVDAFGIDYFTGLFGSLSSGGAGYLGTPTYRNNTDDLRIKSYGIFGETYFKFNDQFKLTLGLRYNHDEKTVVARTTLANFIVPFGSANAYSSPLGARFDADPATVCPAGAPTGGLGSVPGCEAFQVRDHLLYASYSRGYKSGGINPPLSPIFAVSDSFAPEFVNAFEVGSKNQFGALTLNLTGFYYKYNGLQLSRIVARTSVNDNVNANIYGAELEAIIHPVRAMTVNIGASYLHTRVSSDKFLANPRDFGAGRADAVIIKDITNGANCAVASNTGSAAGVNGFVNQTNTLINAGAIPGLAAGAGLRPTTPFPAGGGINSTGAFSVCGVLTALQASVGPAFGGVTVFSSGIPVNIKGNQLPGAPDYKVSMGVQYEFPLGSWSFTPRFDAILTGTTTGNIFNGSVNRIPSYTQYNAQVQLDGPDKRYFVRAYIQNIENSNAITGLYVTDQSSGNYTNIFPLEPRRYGVAAGFKF
jgi:iron complex outermembrane recepter protein